MDKDEALCMALGALEFYYDLYKEKVDANVITAIKAALAQPKQSEPVAIHQFRSLHCADWYDGIPDHHDGHGPYEVRTLYTTPPQRTWVGLTDEEKHQLNDALNLQRRFPIIDVIEAKLKEKNGG